ncbi:hypothetical protein [Nocardia sp. NPDC019302]|uniref:hypothetical protein n=1 Tax=Nocardia sp. NPDC019302 TaxID=3154592 RepID=UPI0034109569
MPENPDEFELPEDQLRLLSESEASGRWMRPLAQEVLTARAVIKSVLALTHQEDDEHSEFGHGHDQSSELECPACWAEEIRDAIQPYIDFRAAVEVSDGRA